MPWCPERCRRLVIDGLVVDVDCAGLDPVGEFEVAAAA